MSASHISPLSLLDPPDREKSTAKSETPLSQSETKRSRLSLLPGALRSEEEYVLRLLTKDGLGTDEIPENIVKQ